MTEHIKDYPFLFHKYILELANPTDPIPYTVLKAGTHQSHICHFHIYNIDIYSEFQPYIDVLVKHYSLIITYCTGTVPSIEFPTSITLLSCLNKGYDIGGKICALDYLQTKAIEYEYILFLHSKTNLDMRKQLYHPLIRSEERIRELKETLSMKQNLLGIFPNYIISDGWAWKKNMKYHDELLQLLNIKDRNRTFAAGNCMILRKSLIDRIFTGNHQLFYNMLNIQESFDLNWYLFRNNLNHHMPSIDVYKMFKHSGIGNNICIHGTSKQFPDAMIEHTFERIWINTINEMGGEYLVVY